MRSPRRQTCGFSLVEVIIAVGIFATAVAVILALLAPLSRQAAASTDSLTALRLPDAIRAELGRLGRVGGFDALAGQTKPMAAPLPATLALGASRDATRIQSLSYLPPAAPDQVTQGDQFFLIEAWTFNQAPMAYDPSGTVLALHVRVSWPYFTPGSAAATPAADREQVTFSLSLVR
jgi:multisubunit Na+/H+ antiporter MnhC subunit